MGRAVTDSSTYELGKTLTWGSIRADVECRASYASGIIGGTHVPLQEHTAAANFFSLGSLYCLGAVEVQGRRRPETFGGGHWQGKADSSRPGCECAAEGAWVVEAARSRWGVLDNRHRTTVGPPDRLEAFAHGKAR